jgi:hypothetical protein
MAAAGAAAIGKKIWGFGGVWVSANGLVQKALS